MKGEKQDSGGGKGQTEAQLCERYNTGISEQRDRLTEEEGRTDIENQQEKNRTGLMGKRRIGIGRGEGHD